MISDVVPVLPRADGILPTSDTQFSSTAPPTGDLAHEMGRGENAVERRVSESTLPAEMDDKDQQSPVAGDSPAPQLVGSCSETQDASKPERKSISWKCGFCGYHVLAMDHAGHPLPLSLSSSGELLPMGCPRCMLEHTNWEQAVPFNEHGDHANIRSRLSNNYVYATRSGGAVVEELPDSAKLLSNTQTSSAVLPPILQEIIYQKCKDGATKSTMHAKPQSRVRRLAYYCRNCDRELLRMDQYGELVPMLSDKDGTPLPVMCPGCKVEHNKWDVRPLKITR